MDKRIPVRTCIGCNNEFPKKDLIRMVRKINEAGEPGSIVFDTSGKANGRGAYLCGNMECFDKALKRKAFERTFKAEIPGNVKEALREELKRLTEE